MNDEEREVVAVLDEASGISKDYIELLKLNDYDVCVLESRDALTEVMPAVLLVFPSEGSDVRAMFKLLKGETWSEQFPLLVLGEATIIEKWLGAFSGAIDGIILPAGRDMLLNRLKILVELSRQEREIRDLHIQLQEAQRMECIGSIAAGVVHEFNNLMFALLGYAEIAKNAPDDLNALRECVDVALQVGKRASSVASSLKAMSQQVRASDSVSDLNDVIKDSLKLLKRYLEEHKVEVQMSLGKLPVSIFSHGQMQQVFINLIINAVQAMTDMRGGRKLVIKTWCDGKSRIAASVQDNGQGMSEECLEQIFTPFFTTKTSGHTEGAGGSGLGLAIVKEVVKSYGGVVHVDSKEGAGSKFTVYLKIAEDCCPAPENDLPIDGMHGAMAPCKVLVVDDEQSNLKMIVRILLKSGFDVYSATSVHDAMAHFWSGDLDLIILDLVMPKVDGAQCISVLREDGIDTPVLICTGVVESPLIQQALDAGAQEVLLKPFSASELLDAIRRCLAKTADDDGEDTNAPA